MSDLKKQLESLNKKYYILQERIKNCKKDKEDLYIDLKNNYGLSENLLSDTNQLKKYLIESLDKCKKDEELLEKEVNKLNAQITIT